MTYSAQEAARLADISYRMLDHWLRNHKLVIADDPTPGSGYRRRFTPREVEALCAMAAIYRAACEVIEEFDSGALWDSVYEGEPHERDQARRRA